MQRHGGVAFSCQCLLKQYLVVENRLPKIVRVTSPVSTSKKLNKIKCTALY